LEVTEESVLEEVLVTGSRIKRDAFSSSTPVDIINTDVSAAQGVADIGELLQSTTIAAGSPQVNSFTSSAITNGGVGAQTLSLRGLGANRTLTLLNGRRVGPAGTRGGVSSFDLNVMPLSAIERVEILKDGASSIYGSDAVAGVVNIITKTDEGGTLEGYVGIPTEGGGEETRFSGRFGKNFDKGRFSVTLDYHMNKELAMGDRDFLACPEMYIFDPDTGERADAVDPRTDSYACRDLIWGHVWIYDYQDPGGNVPSGAKAQYIYNDDPNLYGPSFNDTAAPGDPYAMRTPPGWYPVAFDKASDGLTNFDHPFHDETSFYPETETITFFADGEYQLTDNMEMYAEALLNRRETDVNGYRQFWGYIYNYNYFYGNTLSEGWTGAQWLSPTPITDQGSDTSVQVDYTRFVVGLRGDFSADWEWDLSYQYSNSDGSYTEDQIYNDSVVDQNWLGGSCEGMTTSVRGVPCQDIPWLDPQFLAGVYSPSMQSFLFGRETGNTDYTQWSVEGYVTGELFNMPAGAVATAIGFQYRDDEIKDVPGDITLAGNGWGTTSAGITAGSDTTKAFFAEIDMPLLEGKTGAKYLALNLSGRYTDVDSYGSDTTYKVGINWQITDSIRFRASQGTSFRTPALYELYLADQTSFVGQRNIDPCIQWGDNLETGTISQRVADNCAATTTDIYPNGLPSDFTGGTITATVITGGGLGVLEAETSESKTAGIVWQPEFANLSVSLDYFDIQVDNQVDQLGGGGIVGGCYNSEFWPSDPLCDLFDRSGLNAGIDNVRDSFINVATQTNSGWDFALKYITPLWGGNLSLDTQFTFQDEASTALFEDTVRDNNGEFGEPEWVGRLWTNYDHGLWSYYWGIDFIGDVSNVRDFGGNTTTYRGETVRVVLDSDWVMYNSFSITRNFTQKGVRATFGVRNAFDEEPPQVTTLGLGQLSTEGTSAFYSQYDYLGRRFFLSLSWDFF
jgi:outer membrane receptor protein involved in Fe transport